MNNPLQHEISYYAEYEYYSAKPDRIQYSDVNIIRADLVEYISNICISINLLNEEILKIANHTPPALRTTTNSSFYEKIAEVYSTTFLQIHTIEGKRIHNALMQLKKLHREHRKQEKRAALLRKEMNKPASDTVTFGE